MKKIMVVVSIVLVMAVAVMVAAEHVVVIRTVYQEIGRKTSLLGGVVTIRAERIESKLDGTIVSTEDLGERNIDIDGEFAVFYGNKTYSSENVEYELR